MIKSLNKHTRIRLATSADIPLILTFIKELAEYENMLDQVKATEERLEQSIFKDKRAEVVICEYRQKESDAYDPAGFALFFHNYSTFLAKPGLYLEDLFVRQQYRGKGLGRLLISSLAKIAKYRNCGRFEWACLDWNTASIDFYKKMGAEPLEDWTVFRMTGPSLVKLAEEDKMPVPTAAKIPVKKAADIPENDDSTATI